MIRFGGFLNEATAHQTGKLLRAAVGVSKDSTNDERDLQARFFKWGLSLPVKIEEMIHTTGNKTFTTNWVRPTSWVKQLMRLYPECLTGGFKDPNDIGLQCRSFWKCYRQFHDKHSVFTSPLATKLDRVLPLVLFGDEGRGPKRGQVLIWSIESILGLEDLDDTKPCECKNDLDTLPKADITRSSDAVNSPCTPQEFARATKQTANCKKHSFLTRHLLFALPHWLYKAHPEIELAHIKAMVEDLQSLASNGVEINGVRWYGCVVGSKGDFKHQVAIGNLNRSYNTIGQTYGNAMCCFCKAGTPGFPFECIEHSPVWADSIFDERPWDDLPDLMLLDFDSEKPEYMLKLDLFHLWKVGLGRDLAGSGVVIFCRIGLFDDPNGGDSKDINDRLDRAHSNFKLWAEANHKSPGLQSFSKAYFCMKSFADSPWSNSKGSDTTLLNQWLRFVAALHLQMPTPASQGYERLLRFFRNTADQSFAVFNICYSHGLWLSRTCAKNLYTRMFLLLRGYRCLAQEAYNLGFNAWGFKPKMHAIHHVAFELRSQILTKKKVILNPVCWNNEANEDTVGRVARISRKVATRTLTKRVLERYFLKKRALLKREFNQKKKR